MDMRDKRMDNLKGFLIILVVLGHFLELNMQQPGAKLLYELIYTFHMPAFVFVSGYFFQYDLKRIISGLLYPYLVFQTLYLLFVRLFLKINTPITYKTPYWLMWYLMAMIAWSLLTNVLEKLTGICEERAERFKKGVILLTAVFCALIAGYGNMIERSFSLSRILVFFPFFLAGQFTPKTLRGRYRRLTLILTGCGICLYTIFLTSVYEHTKYVWFYEATPYAADGYSICFRGIHMITAVLFCAFLFWIMPNRELPFLSQAGRNTMQIFLLHGFVVKLCKQYEVFQKVPYPYLTVLAMTLLLVWILSSDTLGKIVRPLMRGPGIKRKK